MLWSLCFLSFLCCHSALAKPVTTIMDDAFQGDTHSSISYSPPEAWLQGSATNHGRVAPDATQAQDGTWHDTTDDTTADHDGTTPTFMDISFQGIGIDVRCIIANNKAANASIPPFTGTKSNYSFFIDTVPQNKDFIHEAGTTGDAFLYNTSVFNTNALSNGPHTLKLLLNGGPDVDGSVLLLFDYAIVTFDDGTDDAGTTTSATQVIPAPRPTSMATTVGSSAKPSGVLSSSQSRTVGPSSLTNTTGAAGSTVQSQRSTSPTPTQSIGPTTASSSPSPISSPAHISNLGAIVGGVGGLLALVLVLFLSLHRKRSHRLRIPKLLPLPYLMPSFRPRSLPPRKTSQVNTSPPSSSPTRKLGPSPSSQLTSSPSGTSASSPEDPAMRDYVQSLRAEVELLREQQQQMVARQSVEPPPRYEDVR